MLEIIALLLIGFIGGFAGGLLGIGGGAIYIPAMVLWVAPVAASAGFGAALLADTLDGNTLRRVFAVVGFYFAITMIVGALREAPKPQQRMENA